MTKEQATKLGRIETLLRKISSQLSRLERAVKREIKQEKKDMSALDDKITELTATVAAEEGVEDSAIALINGFAAQIQAAVAAALAQGATQAQLQALTDLGTSVAAKSGALAAAVAANQPPPGP